MISLKPTALAGVIEIMPKRIGDARGFFSETWNEREFQACGLDLKFVQDNQSRSAVAGTLRGLHFQTSPRPQAKLVRVIQGAIFDVAVDIRKSSPTFGAWVGVELSREKWNQLLVPVGFAHGFVTLVPDTEVLYKVTDYYSPEHDRSIRFDDPAIGVKWPSDLGEFTLSEKDRNAPLLAGIMGDLSGPFQ